MKMPIWTPFPPMEAETVDEIPEGSEWQYEPKWDGFRCVAFRDGANIELQSKAGQPLARYFPELVKALAELEAKRFVLDGEIVVPHGAGLSFEDLLQRIHPAAKRIDRLARETPARLIAFDLLVDERGRDLTARALSERRMRLEAFASRRLDAGGTIALSPATLKRATAERWLDSAGGGLDGVIAKKRDEPYRSGERIGMVKVKNIRSAECVVGGFRYSSTGKGVGSLLLGLYDEEGDLHHVGFTTPPPKERAKLARRLEALIAAPGFTGRAPGGESRWSRGKSSEWQPLEAKLVVEVEFDHFSGDRFRHGAKFMRWRPDKAAVQCTFEQIAGRKRLPVRV
jgi:ATP-dependent DNA ligase